MAMNVSDLLNFTADGSVKQNENCDLLALQSLQHQLVQLNINERRNSFDNNPFDRAAKQVETYRADPFELVSAQSLNYSPANSSVITANLIDFNQDCNKENNSNNDANRKKDLHKKPDTSVSSPTKRRSNSNKDSLEKSSAKRDSLLKYSLANASKSTMATVSTNNFMSEKWMDEITENDSFNDLMKQEINLVDSDGSDFETDFKIPILEHINKKFEPESVTVRTINEFEESTNRVEFNSPLNVQAIAKLNEIKSAHSRKAEEMEETVNKLKEMVNKIEGDAGSEASRLLEQLCSALSKKSEKKKEASAPPHMIRQGTFDIDRSEDGIDDSDLAADTSDNNSQVQNVIEQLSKALGNVSLNVLQTGTNDVRSVNPVVVVVVNSDPNYGMSDTITLNHTSNESTPPLKTHPRRSQSFSSHRNSVVDSAKKGFELHQTPQRATQPKRRSFSFNTPNSKVAPLKRQSILPSNPSNNRPPVSAAAQNQVTGVQKRTSILDKIKPKISFGTNSSNKTSKVGPLKATAPLNTVMRRKSPDKRSIQSLPVRTTPMKPIAASTPTIRTMTPQKPTHSRISFLTPTRPSTSANYALNSCSGLTRRRSLNDKDRPKPVGLTSINSMPRPTTNVPDKAVNTGNIGTLTQRKFPTKPNTATSIYASKTRPVTTIKTFRK